MTSDREVDALFSSSVTSNVLPRWERKLQRKTPVGTPSRGDRFIPNREAMNTGISLSLNNENSAPSAGENAFQNQLAQSLFDGEDLNSKILAFKKKAPKPSEQFQNNLRVLYSANQQNPSTKMLARHIPATPERILDAPDLLDDFYLNLLDWSAGNVMAVGLGQCVYLWDASSGDINLLYEAEDEKHVTSVGWMGDGSHLAIGMSSCEVQMWDVTKQKKVRTMNGHQARVSSIAWNNHILSSGSRDTNIFHHDVRIAQHHIATLTGHSGEICGLKWSPDGMQLASGANDNVVKVWDAGSSQAKYTFTESSAAVKALAWCPFEKNVLATGGGTADRHIRFYNTEAGTLQNSIDTQSQVCSLQWSKHSKELLSAHGFSQNQLSVWSYPTMAKIADLTGHSSRVLHTCLSADGTTVCSAAADETLRFWKVWDAPAPKKRPAPLSTFSTKSKLDRSIR